MASVRAKKCRWSLDGIGELLAAPARMHGDDAGARLHGRRGHVGIFLQTLDIVEDMRAGGDRQTRGVGAVGVHGEDRIGATGEFLDDRQDARLLLRSRHGRRAGARRLPADVDYRGPSSTAFSAFSTAVSAARLRPPSEKESGVTLITAMITASGPSVRLRPCASFSRRARRARSSEISARNVVGC